MTRPFLNSDNPGYCDWSQAARLKLWEPLGLLQLGPQNKQKPGRLSTWAESPAFSPCTGLRSSTGLNDLSRVQATPV